MIQLSGGQQRRLDVAIALAGDPELLFLDEPTTGFDPSARHEAWQVVKNLADLGKTVLLTTHYMDEAQYLADRVAVIARGRIVAEGPPATLAGATRPRPGPLPPARGRQPPAGLGGRAGRDGLSSSRPTTCAPRCTGSPAGRSNTTSRWTASRSSGRRSRTSTWSSPTPADDRALAGRGPGRRQDA